MQDATVIARHHVGDDSLEGVEAAVDIDPHDALEIREVDFVTLDVGASGNASAIDEDVEASRLGCRLIHSALHRKGVGDIGLRNDSLLANRGRGTLQRRGVGIEKHEPDPAGSESLGHGQAERVGSAGDHCALSGPSR